MACWKGCTWSESEARFFWSELRLRPQGCLWLGQNWKSFTTKGLCRLDELLTVEWENFQFRKVKADGKEYGSIRKVEKTGYGWTKRWSWCCKTYHNARIKVTREKDERRNVTRLIFCCISTTSEVLRSTQLKSALCHGRDSQQKSIIRYRTANWSSSCCWRDRASIFN